VTDELRAAVARARESRKLADDAHEHVKSLLIRARVERPDLGPDDLEAMTDKYFDRGTISRITVPALRELGHEPARKPSRRRPRS